MFSLTLALSNFIMICLVIFFMCPWLKVHCTSWIDLAGHQSSEEPQTKATKPSTERPQSHSCRAWAKVSEGPSHTQGHPLSPGLWEAVFRPGPDSQPSAEGAALALGLEFGELAGVLAQATDVCEQREPPHSNGSRFPLSLSVCIQNRMCFKNLFFLFNNMHSW